MEGRVVLLLTQDLQPWALQYTGVTGLWELKFWKLALLFLSGIKMPRRIRLAVSHLTTRESSQKHKIFSANMSDVCSLLMGKDSYRDKEISVLCIGCILLKCILSGYWQ